MVIDSYNKGVLKMKYLKLVYCVMLVALLGACSDSGDSSSNNGSLKGNFKDMGDSIGHAARDVTRSIGHDSRNIVDVD